MPFIPNEADAAFPDQAEPDSVDFEMILDGVSHNGVISGCTVTAQVTPDTTVAIAVGTYTIDLSTGRFWGTLPAQASPPMPSDPTYPRFYLVCANAVGAIVVVSGPPSNQPTFPTIPVDCIVIASVYRPPNNNAIIGTYIIDKRAIVSTAYLFTQLAVGPIVGTAITPKHIIDANVARTITDAGSARGVAVTGTQLWNTTGGGDYYGVQVAGTSTLSANLAMLRLGSFEQTINGAGTLAEVNGLRTEIVASMAAGGLIGTARGVYARYVRFFGSEIATNVTLFEGDSTGGGGTGSISTLIGLKLTGLAGATVMWGIQVGDVPSFHQGPVTIGTNVAPALSAVLDVNSTSKGILPPRMTTAQRDVIASPAAGLLIYNTTTNSLNLYTGTRWSGGGNTLPDPVTTSATSAASTGAQIKDGPLPNYVFTVDPVHRYVVKYLTVPSSVGGDTISIDIRDGLTVAPTNASASLATFIAQIPASGGPGQQSWCFEQPLIGLSAGVHTLAPFFLRSTGSGNMQMTGTRFLWVEDIG